ncbi:MAG: hypothetical protein ACP5O2_10575 [Bacteroidales bacterium]
MKDNNITNSSSISYLLEIERFIKKKFVHTIYIYVIVGILPIGIGFYLSFHSLQVNGIYELTYKIFLLITGLISSYLIFKFFSGVLIKSEEITEKIINNHASIKLEEMNQSIKLKTEILNMFKNKTELDPKVVDLYINNLLIALLTIDKDKKNNN